MKDNFVPHSDNSDNSISSSVIDRARQGDQDAFRRISALYSGLVYHWCRTSGLSPHDAEDVGQQVFLTVSRSLHLFARKKPGDSFRAWLRVIARSRVIDHFRENAHREVAVGGEKNWSRESMIPFSLSEEESDEERIGANAMIYEKAISLIQGEFADQDFRAFHLVVVEGLVPKDVAAQLGVSLNSVYIAKSRILKRLRDEFNELLDSDSAKN